MNPTRVVHENDLAQHLWVVRKEYIDGTFQRAEVNLPQMQTGEVNKHNGAESPYAISSISVVLEERLDRSDLSFTVNEGLFTVWERLLSDHEALVQRDSTDVLRHAKQQLCKCVSEMRRFEADYIEGTELRVSPPLVQRDFSTDLRGVTCYMAARRCAGCGCVFNRFRAAVAREIGRHHVCVTREPSRGRSSSVGAGPIKSCSGSSVSIPEGWGGDDEQTYLIMNDELWCSWTAMGPSSGPQVREDLGVASA
ncbi:hypothetical protein FGB62_23g20 [Gracilaria domingensis]|nr:hypothetical protein FGB62_23g20 [Gracilaria domingensis]